VQLPAAAAVAGAGLPARLARRSAGSVLKGESMAVDVPALDLGGQGTAGKRTPALRWWCSGSLASGRTAPLLAAVPERRPGQQPEQQ
jgi:hypothetical protein